jgi:hypothetical protein
MPKYKFTRIYVVEADTKAAAMEKVKQNPSEYLEYEGSSLVAERQGGWGQSFRKQVTGK